MLDVEGINYWAVLVAWIINCIIGALWYSPVGFAKQWEKYTGINILKIPEKEATQILGAVVVAGFVQAFVLALVLNSLDLTSVGDGLATGMVLWLGLTAATTVGVTLYSRRKWGFWWLNSSYFLLVMSINSIILSAWQ